MMDPLFVLGFGYVAPDEVVEARASAREPNADQARAGAREPNADQAREQGARIGEPLKLDLGLLERSLRRGLSDVTRLFMHAAQLALAHAALAPERAHVVFASAFGEIATADVLLAEAYDANASSPARFRHSVHNTAAGLLSISAKSRLPSTALAAGWDTVAMGLCEASAQLASVPPRDPAREQHEAEHVLLVFAEERVPFTLSAEHSYGPLGVAFVLGRRDSERVGPVRGRLSRLRRAEREAGPRDHAAASTRAIPRASEVMSTRAIPRASEVMSTRAIPRASEMTRFDHPLAPALGLARALASERSQTLIVGGGDFPWCIDVDAGEP